MTKSNTLYVSGLDVSLVEANLREEFSKHCQIDRVTVIRDKSTRVSKGFAYIVCKTDADASIAMREMDGKVLMDRPIKVKYSHSETPEWVSILENRGSLKEESSPIMPPMFRGGRGGPMFSRGGRGSPMRGGPSMRGGSMRGGPMRGGSAVRGRGGPRGGYGVTNGDSPRGRGAPPVRGRDAAFHGRDNFQDRGDGPPHGRESRGRSGPPRGQTGPPRGRGGPVRGQSSLRGRGGPMHGQEGPASRDRGYLGYDNGEGYDMDGADRGESALGRRRPQLDERPSRPLLHPEASGGRYPEDDYGRGASMQDPYSERPPVRRSSDVYPQRRYDDGYERRPTQDPYNDGYTRDPIERPPPRGAYQDRREPPERSQQPEDYPPSRDTYRERSPIRRDQYLDDPYAQKSSHIDASYRPEARPPPHSRDPYAAPVGRNDHDRRPEIGRYGDGADSLYPSRAAERAPPPQRQYAAPDPYSQTGARSLKEPVGRSGGRPLARAGYGGY